MHRLGRLVALATLGCTPHDGKGPVDPGTSGGDPTTGTPAPTDDGDGDGFASDVDCDDGDPTVFPGAPDVCGDDRVTDCDRESDDGLVTLDGAATFTNLQDALDAATAGSEVLVCPGTYLGRFSSAVNVALIGHGGAAVTVLDGLRQWSTLILTGGSTVRGLTLQGGRVAGYGGGLAVTGPGTFTVDGCVIRDNIAGNGGGIALPDGGTAVIRDSTISHNRTKDGSVKGGLGGGLYVAGGTADLTGTTVSSNHADEGGGIFVVSSSLTGGTVSGNRADTSSGGLSLDDSTATDVIVEGNDGPFYGGVGITGTSAVTGGRIAGNTASYGAACGCPDGASVVFDGVEIVDNSASSEVGALILYAADAVFRGCTVHRNTGLLTTGGVWIGLGGTLVSTDTDWGSGADDNSPSDVYPTGGDELTGYGVASFDCDDSSCSPAP